MTLSEHLRLEIAHAVHRGHRPGDQPPLGREDPVPGCACVICLAIGAGASRRQARELEEIVQHLALLPPDHRDEAVETANQERERLGRDPLPLGAATLARLAQIRGVRDCGSSRRRDPFPEAPPIARCNTQNAKSSRQAKLDSPAVSALSPPRGVNSPPP